MLRVRPLQRFGMTFLSPKLRRLLTVAQVVARQTLFQYCHCGHCLDSLVLSV